MRWKSYLERETGIALQARPGTRDPLLGKIRSRDLCLTEPENGVFRPSLPSDSRGHSPLPTGLSCCVGKGSRTGIVLPSLRSGRPCTRPCQPSLWRVPISRLGRAGSRRLRTRRPGCDPVKHPRVSARRRPQCRARRAGVRHCDRAGGTDRQLGCAICVWRCYRRSICLPPRRSGSARTP